MQVPSAFVVIPRLAWVAFILNVERFPRFVLLINDRVTGHVVYGGIDSLP